MYSQIITLGVLIVLSAIFSGSETALISLTNSKVDELVNNKAANSKLLKRLKKDPHRLLITVLIGNNIVNIGASAYAAVLFTEIFDSNGIGIATGVMTFLILIFGEIVPKSFAHQHAEGFSLFISKPIFVMQIIFFPFVWFFDKLVILTNRFFGKERTSTVTEGEIVAMLNIGEQEGAIEKHEKELIENVLEFNDIEVEEVMTPRVSFEALSSETTLEEAVKFVETHSHTRLPVYEENLDNIIGIINIKELLTAYSNKNSNTKLKNLSLTPVMEVPFSKKINKLFREFQRKHQHIAIVIDEHGGTAGLVTMEDLLEEIVGEIVDESDEAENPIEIVNKNTIIVNGTTLIEDINDFFKIKFAANERDTVNTFLLDHLHRFPREGETVNLPRARVIILKMGRNVIEKVKIKKRNHRINHG